MPLLSRTLLFLSLAAGLANVSSAQVMTVPTKPAQPAAAPGQIDPAARNQVIADLRAKKFDEALAGAKAILAANPNSNQANKLVGVVLLDDQKPTEALSYLQKALSLDANDPSVHALLVQAYAQGGDKKNRDEQIAILRGFRSDGKHPDFTRSMGFLVETIRVHDKIVQAVEFYDPAGKEHFYYRFNVFDSTGHLQSFLGVEADDADQAAYAKEHPQEAAAGGHRFSIDYYAPNAQGLTTQGVITVVDGKPTYDELRPRIIKILENDTKPATMKTLTPTAPPASSPK